MIRPIDPFSYFASTYNRTDPRCVRRAVAEPSLKMCPGELKDTLSEHTVAFGPFSVSILYLTAMIGRDGILICAHGLSQSKHLFKMNFDKDRLKDNAKSAQKAFGEFDEKCIYHTTIDPFPGTR